MFESLGIDGISFSNGGNLLQAAVNGFNQMVGTASSAVGALANSAMENATNVAKTTLSVAAPAQASGTSLG